MDKDRSVEETNFNAKSASALERVRIVLVETSHPGNLGAAARAMKTMGLKHLYLVAPRCAIDEEARARASRAVDVLEAAVICDDLGPALADCVLTAATTSRRRDLPHPAYTPRQAAPALLAAAQEGPVALVFGSETFGLTNEQLAKCRWLINIPTNPDYGSLNLAAAVQVLAYELRCTLDDRVLPLPRFDAASHAEIEALLAELEHTLTAIGFLDPRHPKRLMPRLRRFFARAGLEREEVAIWRGILNALGRPRED
ncbi:MAG: RNA methyltransferase [Thiobacillaceae bacterium]|nr:RNA methyltransferase [Thiobacillaceae bacterium]